MLPPPFAVHGFPSYHVNCFTLLEMLDRLEPSPRVADLRFDGLKPLRVG